ncbi:MAG: NAD(P)-dependent oxidoreductase, partial [Sphingomonadales bacterium]
MSPERRKIVLTTEWPKAAMDALRGDYELVVALGGPGSADFAAALTGAEAFCPVYYDRIDSALIAALPASIRIIASFGVGTDHIDLQAAAKRGLPVSNTPDVLTDDTADIAIGLMIAASRGFSEREHALRAGQWKGPSITGDLWQSFSSKTLGIVGLGRIGAAVARRAKAFGMRLLYTSPSHKPALEEELGLAYREHLSELLADSDFVSLHTPLNASTRHLIDAGRLAQMKSSGVLVNTGRG